VRRRKPNIFEISDEIWQRDGAIPADGAAVEPDVFVAQNSAETRASAAVELSHSDSERRGHDLHPRRGSASPLRLRQLAVAAAAAVAGAITVASIAPRDRATQPSTGRAGRLAPARPTPGLAQRLERAPWHRSVRDGPVAAERKERTAPVSAVGHAPARSISVRMLAVSPATEPDETEDVGQEFSFER
jgi:hypothetical protein